MEPPTEIERLKIDVEIANAKSTLALLMLKGLVASLHRSGFTDETISNLASIPYIQETEGGDPAMAIAAMELRTPDPDMPTEQTMRADRAEFERHWRNLLDAIRRHHQGNS